MSVGVDAVVVDDSVKRRTSVDAVSVVMSVYSEVATVLWMAVTIFKNRLAGGVMVNVNLATQSARPSSPAATTAGSSQVSLWPQKRQ